MEIKRSVLILSPEFKIEALKPRDFKEVIRASGRRPEFPVALVAFSIGNRFDFALLSIGHGRKGDDMGARAVVPDGLPVNGRFGHRH